MLEWSRRLYLLIWKDFLIQIRNPFAFILEIVIPILIYLLMLRLRINPTEVKKPTQYYPQTIGVGNLGLLQYKYNETIKWELDFYPNYPKLSTLVAEAAKELNLSTRGFNNLNKLENFFKKNQPLVAIVFDSPNEYPRKLIFSLRFPNTLRTETGLQGPLTWRTNRLYDIKDEMNGPRSDGNPDYIREGFIVVQNAISLSYIKLIGNMSEELPEISLQRFPYPPYTSDGFLLMQLLALGIIIMATFLSPCYRTVTRIIVEKDLQLKEMMKIMGLTTSLHWTSWFIFTMIVLVLIAVLSITLLKVKWFEKAAAILPHSSCFWLLMFFLVYATASITLCFLISTFLKKPSIAAPVVTIIWAVTVLPYIFTENIPGMPLYTVLPVCLLSNSALQYGASIIVRWEAISMGIQWENIFKNPGFDSGLSFGMVMIMLLIDATLYMLLTLYIEKIRPGSYGLAEVWYFPCTKSFWCPRRTANFEKDITKPVDSDRHEPQTQGADNIGVQLINLRKEFGSIVAVDNLNFELYENQVTMLLGHNGAGKTTTISMITGLIPPTSGKIIINGMSLEENSTEIRKILGICPQHNILFDDLTVEEHILFYSMLRGLNLKDSKLTMRKYLEILDLKSKGKSRSKNLSGGMKRKLSVGIAMCGDAKVVLCDEPSSGMDPASRRSLWELIRSEKQGRTILLTTHLMDEADAVGDRIAIMSSGRIQSSGTSFFLKKRFGVGYKLICSKKPDCDTREVTKLVQQFVPEAIVKSDVGQELSYQLPEKYAHTFERLLKRLEQSLDALKLNGYGITSTSLEDVFLGTGTEAETLKSSTEQVQFDSLVNSMPTVSLRKHYTYQWYAMFYKKIINFVRCWYLFVIQLLLCVCYVLLMMYSSQLKSSSKSPALKIVPGSYGKSVIFLEYIGNDSFSRRISESYKRAYSSNIKLLNSPLESSILGVSKGNLYRVNRKYVVAATIGFSKIIAWYNNQALHAAPLTLNLIHNAIARTVLGSDHTITVINDPILTTEKKAERFTDDDSFQFAFIISMIMSIVTSIFIMFIITERLSKSKMMQFISGVQQIIFWIVHLLFDFLVYAAIALVLAVMLNLLQKEGCSTVYEMGCFYLSLIAYGIAVLPVIYLMSFVFTEPANGIAWMITFQVIIGAILFIVSISTNFIGFNSVYEKAALIFPTYALCRAIYNQCQMVMMNKLLAQDFKTKSSDNKAMELLQLEYPGIAWPLIYMFSIGLLTFIILLCVDSVINIISCICNSACCRQSSKSGSSDDDVQAEKNRVAKLTKSEIAQHFVVARDLTKYFRRFLAVSHVSFVIDEGECFGLLGPNGAGKTTALRMLIGDLKPSKGHAWIRGKSVASESSAIYKIIGYCPQFDGLLMEFTGMETIKMFSIIRGISATHIQSLSKTLGKMLGFEKHLKKRVKELSGGNRQKLSTVLTFLGRPHVIFLDEPTTGIDPTSRRKLWDIICSIRDSGTAIVLTSHSMEECEALCTRVTIMGNGQLRCIGSVQHLKNKYSPEITVVIKLYDSGEKVKGDVQADNLRKHLEKVVEFMRNNFRNSILKYHHGKLATFEIQRNTLPYSAIFGLIESNKSKLQIEDYSISQATLEQVFLQFPQR